MTTGLYDGVTRGKKLSHNDFTFITNFHCLLPTSWMIKLPVGQRVPESGIWIPILYEKMFSVKMIGQTIQIADNLCHQFIGREP